MYRFREEPGDRPLPKPGGLTLPLPFKAATPRNGGLQPATVPPTRFAAQPVETGRELLKRSAHGMLRSSESPIAPMPVVRFGLQAKKPDEYALRPVQFDMTFAGMGGEGATL